jgi:hypothetical protein
VELVKRVIGLRIPLVAAAVILAGAACDDGGDGPDGPGGGGLPDLVVSESRLQASTRTDWIYVTPEACSIEGACVSGSGWRRVVRFTTEIQNRGDGALSLGAPGEGNGNFAWDGCRDRHRITVAPTYRLLDAGGETLRESRAEVSCWADTVRLNDVDGPSNPEFPTSHQTCTTNQGISPGWAFIQSPDEDCQLIDVTDLPAGTYRLEVTVDAEDRLEKKGDGNGTATVTFELGPSDEHPVCVDADDCHVPEPGSCEGITCPFRDEEATCDGDVSVVTEAPGTCHPRDGVCIETRIETDCAANGNVCRDGVCVDLCEGVSCEAPEPACEGDVAVAYVAATCDPATGTCGEPERLDWDCASADHVCEDAECVDLCDGVTCTSPDAECVSPRTARSYGESACDWRTGVCTDPEVTAIACNVDERVCHEGACIDLCAGVTCTAPAGHCDGDEAVVYVAGTCDWETGECSGHTEAREDCTESERLCLAGGCLDLCEGVDCGETHRSCDGDDVVIHTPGTCDWTTGVCGEGEVHEIACGSGETCVGGFCRTPDSELPDLTVNGRRLANSLSIGWEYFPPDSCAIGEECIGSPGWRRLIRFTTVLENRGEGPVHLGNPVGHPDFEYDACHFHYHYLNATDYDLLNEAGTEVVLARKQSFCMYDVHRIPGFEGGWDEPAYPASDETCNTNQGLSPGWVDVYPSSLDCQFIDVTGVPAGTYTIRVTVNSEGLIEESDYSNNVVRVPVTLPPTDGPPSP